MEALLLVVMSLQPEQQSITRDVPLGIEKVSFCSKELFKRKDLSPSARLRDQVFIWGVRAGMRTEDLTWLSQGPACKSMFWTGASRFESYDLIDIGIRVASVRGHENSSAKLLGVWIE